MAGDGSMDFDPAQLREFGRQIVELVSSPEFMEHVQHVFETDESSRLSEAASRLTPAALREAGLPVPEFTRITSRYFEEDPADEVVFTDTEAGTDILQVLHDARPGILDDIRDVDDELWKRLKQAELPRGRFDPAAGLCVCAGGGPGWSVCVGGGA
jgi:hypothetical protein